MLRRMCIERDAAIDAGIATRIVQGKLFLQGGVRKAAQAEYVARTYGPSDSNSDNEYSYSE